MTPPLLMSILEKIGGRLRRYSATRMEWKEGSMALMSPAIWNLMPDVEEFKFEARRYIRADLGSSSLPELPISLHTLTDEVTTLVDGVVCSLSTSVWVNYLLRAPKSGQSQRPDKIKFYRVWGSWGRLTDATGRYGRHEGVMLLVNHFATKLEVAGVTLKDGAGTLWRNYHLALLELNPDYRL